MTKEEIVEEIKKSRKYSGIYEKTIERVVDDCLVRFGEKRAEKEAKNLLHQIWGAFYPGQLKWEKVLESLTKENVLDVLRLHSSVKERLPILEDFYKKIFAVTGQPKSIIDHACGLNPLTIAYMNLPADCAYKAYDIDEQEINFLNKAFEKLSIKNAKAYPGDVLVDDFDYADVVFFLKLLPSIEQQKKGSSLEILQKNKFKYGVVSFPVKSIGGKEKGMADFYGNNFKNMIEKEKWEIMEILFDTELVFIVEKPALPAGRQFCQSSSVGRAMVS